uniref:Ion transport domain-containing protein n=1 Tax=Anopheles quadriannulatus TaxID=34691 RepID=A0A182X6M7_ANOQN
MTQPSYYVSKYAGEFCKLVVEGDFSKIKSKFKEFVLDYQTPEDLNTPLHLSIIAQQNRNEIIQFLVESGADCDLRNSMNLTASELAINLNFMDVTKFMLAVEFRNLTDYRCFYRLIRRGSVPLLQLFLELKSFDIHQQIAYVSSVWHELYVKNVPLTKSMENFLEYQLQNYSYAYHHPPAQPRPDRPKFDRELEQRIELIVEYTRYLTKHYGGTDNLNDYDDKFLLAIKIVYDNLFFVREKRELVGSVPVEEICRLLAVFLAIFKKAPHYEVYKLLLNKRTVLQYLGAVSDELERIKAELAENRGRESTRWTNELLLYLLCCIRDAAPAKSTKAINGLWRKKCVLKKKLIYYVKGRLRANPELAAIQARYVNNLTKPELEVLRQELRAPEFVELTRATGRRNRVTFCRLRKTYDHVAQLYAIKKILRYLDGIARIQLPQYQVSGVLAIKRTLQVIAETVASTRYAPAIARKLDSVVHKILPLNLDVDVRDFYQPNVSLYKACSDRAENGRLVLPFAEVQCSLKSVRRYFAYVHDLKMLEAYKCYLGNVHQLKNWRQVASYNQFVGDANRMYFENHTLDDLHFELEDCIRVVEELQETFSQQQDEKLSDLLRCVYRPLAQRYETLTKGDSERAALASISANFSTVMQLCGTEIEMAKVRRIVGSFLAESYPKYDICSDEQLLLLNPLMQELLHLFTNYLYQYQMDERVTKNFVTMVEVLHVGRYIAVDHFVPERTKPCDSLLHQNYTNDILKKFNLQNLSSIEFAVLHEQLSQSYYDNCYNLDKKYAVLTMFFKSTNRPVNDAIVKRNKRMDREEFQSFLDAKLKLIGQFLPCSDFNEVTQFINEAAPHVEYALEHCLLELCEILTDLGVFQDNQYVLKLQSANVSGRNLHDYLRQDALEYDMLTLTHSTKVKVFLNGLIFKSNEFKLYQPPTSQRANPDELLAINENLINNYKMRWSWVEQQERLFKSVETIDLKLLQALTPDYADIRGMRLGVLCDGTPSTEYEIIDHTIRNNLKQMVDYLSEELQAISYEKKQFFQYVLVRSSNSLFIDAHFSLTTVQERQATILFMALYFRAYDVFLECVKRFELTVNLGKIVKYLNLEFIEKIAKQMKDINWNCQDGNGTTVLDQCVQKGDLAAIKKLIKLGVDIASQTSDGTSALHRACSLGHTDIAKLLVKQQVPLTSLSGTDRLPLHYAIQYQEHELLPVLCCDDIDINSDRHRLVRRAIEYGNLEALKYLVDTRQATLTFVDQQQNTVLHLCATYGRLAMLRYLLDDHSATIDGEESLLNRRNGASKTVLHIAVQQRHTAMVALLLERGVDASPTDDTGRTAYEWAVQGNSLRIAKVFAKHQRTLRSSGAIASHPLTIAIEQRNVRMLKFLLRNGCSFTSESLCLIKAVYTRSLELVRYIVELCKPALQYRDPYDSTPLHVAIAIECNEIAAYLIESGADINAISKFGDTPLHVAARHGNIVAARMLILKYAAVDERNASGLTALMQAMYSRQLDIMKLLIGAGANIDLLKLHLAEIEQLAKLPTIHMFVDHYGLLEFMILQLQYDPNVRDGRNQQSLLHKACYANNLQIVQFLVDWCRLQTEQQDANGRTPLAIANECKNYEVAEFLRSKKRKKSQIAPQRYFDPAGMM